MRTPLHVTYCCQKLAVRIVLDSPAVMIVKHVEKGVQEVTGADRSNYWIED
jgi:hypothetical protein